MDFPGRRTYRRSMTHAPIRFLDRSTPPHIATLVLLTGLGALAMNVFLPSLPKMAEWYAAPYALMQLTVAGFLATNAVMQIFIGPLSDKFGRRPMILAGVLVFCLATVGCLLAENVYVFLFFRMMQAAVAVGFALSRAVVRDMFPPDKAASMMGYVTMGMSLVPMVAPAVGGLIDETLGWRASFWLMLILGVLILVLVWADLGETARKSDRTVLGQFREYPELLTSPRFWGYCLACAFSSGAFFAFLGGAPYVGSEVFGMTPAEFGIWAALPGIGYFLGNFLTGLIAARVGVNRMVMAGSLTLASGMAGALILGWLGFGGPEVFFGAMIFVGIGNGMTIPSATSGMLSVRPHLAGTASGLGGTMQIGGGAALSVVAGLILGPGSDETPLLLLMFTTALCGLVAILIVVRREKKLGLTLS